MPQALVGGRRLAYRDAGSGLPVLLLHGFPLSSEAFWPQLDAPPHGVRFLAVDHRGFGDSDLPDGPSTMEAMAADALALLDVLGVARAVAAGVSMGGYVALALARTAPERLLGLALLDTRATADDAATRAGREAVAATALTEGVAPVAKAMLPRLLSPAAPAPLRERLEALICAQAPRAVAAASRGMALRGDARDVLRGFAGPCLVLVGADDVITPPAEAQAMVALARAPTLVTVPRAGHLANLEQPEAVGHAVEAFVAGVRAG